MNKRVNYLRLAANEPDDDADEVSRQLRVLKKKRSMIAAQSAGAPSGKRKLASLMWLGKHRSEKTFQGEKAGVWLVLSTWLLIFLVILVAVFVAVRLRRSSKGSHPFMTSSITSRPLRDTCQDWIV